MFKKRDFEAIFQKSFRVTFFEKVTLRELTFHLFVFKRKQLQAMHEKQIRKQHKLWALIEASTERYLLKKRKENQR